MSEKHKRKSSTTKTENRVAEITERLEQGIQELFESDRYKAYLKTMAKFYDYSVNNTILIAMQNPAATMVAGYQAWQNKFGRYVKAGEKGIRILAPMPYKVKIEKEQADPQTGQTIKNEDGDPVTVMVEGKRLYGFRVVTVFDISQTAGKELPSLGVQELSGNVERYDEFLAAIRNISPVPMEWEEIPGSAKGYYSRSEQRIVIRKGMSQIQTIKTAIHELAHAKLHGVVPEENGQESAEVLEKTRKTKEVEAESVAYTICQRYGIETSDYSFGYIAGWSSGKDMKELKSSLETIRRTSAELIQSLDLQLQMLTEAQAAEVMKGGEVPSATFTLSMS